ncbi:interleukin-1 receptor type 1-like [Amblyraja radiata]|uniref:interleukin-1 receptor type 1-like n=1 Tax=Amblyraja radiata TaxID=386614 RepID=UPI001403F29A|nr:interleukin-1 receptor type 1-like [Amblyraja radiata]
MYTCSLEFVHFDRRFNVTQTMELKIELIKLIQPELMNPKNNTIQARLGSELNVTCEAHLGSGNLQMYGLSWMNIPKDNLRIKQGPKFRKKGTGPTFIIRRTLIISKIIEEDFQTKFDCVAHNSLGYGNTFLKLSRQSPDGIYDVITVFIPLIFGFLACFAIYVIFKVEIVLWYRDSFASPKIVHDGKTFDAYVIYPRSENKGSLDKCNSSYFALHILPQILEEKYGYKLFIYGRDELPGQAAAEVIEDNIRSSRRLIIILTWKPSADDQAYSGFERQVGLFEALIRNEIKVILIELEKFDCLNDFPASIRHIIQKNGTIKWKSYETSKPNAACSRFWKQVRYKMPARNKTCSWVPYDSATY